MVTIAAKRILLNFNFLHKNSKVSVYKAGIKNVIPYIAIELVFLKLLQRQIRGKPALTKKLNNPFRKSVLFVLCIFILFINKNYFEKT
jgi:hypothetical protein